MIHFQNADGSTGARGSCSGDSRFLPFDWTVEVHATPGAEGGMHYFADLYRSGEPMCRIALSGTFTDPALAEEALWKRLKTWLNDYEMRPHSGDSGFHIL